MTKYRRIAMTVASSLLLASGSASAASDYLLEIPGVAGEAATKGGSNSIEVQSFSWGVTNTSTAGASTGAGAGKVNVQDISMTRRAAVVATDAAAAPAPGSGAGAGKVNMQDLSVTSDAAAAAQAPAVGSVVTVNVVVDPASGGTAARLAQACATGKHFDKVVLTARGTRYELQDVSVTCPAPIAGKRAAAGFGKAHELKGHVTLIK